MTYEVHHRIAMPVSLHTSRDNLTTEVRTRSVSARFGGDLVPTLGCLKVDPQSTLALCAVHALRNAAQDFDTEPPIFAQALLEQGAASAASRLGDHVSFHMNLADATNYSIEALSAAVSLTGVFVLRELPSAARAMETDPTEAIKLCFGQGEANGVLGLLMHVPGHYVAWRLVEDGDDRHAVLLDSLRPALLERCPATAFADVLRAQQQQVISGELGLFPVYQIWQLARSSASVDLDAQAAAFAAGGGSFAAPKGHWRSQAFQYEGSDGVLESPAKRPRGTGGRD